LLRQLAEDTHYAVRRAAYRALAAISPESLSEMLVEWVSLGLEYRKRAAEAQAWAVNRGNPSLTSLATDAERSVREAFSAAEEQRLERTWSQRYLNAILHEAGTRGALSQHALVCGEALKRIGDDDARAAVKRRLNESGLAPHARYWLIGVEKALKKRWDEVTRKWPQPWAELRGEAVSGVGFLEQNGERIKVRYQLWFKAGSEPRELPSWGGRLLQADDTHAIQFGGKDPILHMEDGRTGQVMIVQLKSGAATIVGQGALPAMDS
jgi:hypothetical protein